MGENIEDKKSSGIDNSIEQAKKVQQLAAINRAAALGLAVCLVVSTAVIGCGKGKQSSKDEEEDDDDTYYTNGGSYHGSSNYYTRGGSYRSGSSGNGGFLTHPGKCGGYSGVRGGSFGS